MPTRLTHRTSRRITGLFAAAALLLGASVAAHPAAADYSPPQVLSATALSNTTIRVTWRDTSATEDYFTVVYAPQGDTSGRSSVYSNLLPPLTGTNRIGSYDVQGLRTGTTYCFMVLSYTEPDADDGSIVGQYSPDSNRICALAQSPALSSLRNACLTCTALPAPAPAPAPLPKAPAMPANFRGERHPSGGRIILQWTDGPTEDYYYLTATSHVGGVGQMLAAPAPKLNRNTASFIVEGNAVNVLGGADFALQACNARGCSARATLTVP